MVFVGHKSTPAGACATTDDLGDRARYHARMPSSEAARRFERARRAWPGVEVAPARFAAFFDERAARDGAGKLHADDLYLACACLDGDARALRAFGALLDQVARKLRRLAPNDAALADAKQAALEQVMARGDRAAALANYTGRGPLGGWLRIVLGRELFESRQKAGREPSADTGELAAVVDRDDDPETAHLKTHYRREFKEAFAAAMARLDDDERRALRYAIVERIGIDDVARLEGVHRATAARKVARARARLNEETRRVMRDKLEVDAAELDSVLRLIESQVDASVRRLLAR
jgi:RNA polymerase sigma-70 factor (ECF subfamily)